MEKEKESRIENPVVLEYIYRFVPKKLNDIPIFVKVFGEDFARRRLRSGVLTVYTNEPVGIRNYAGYYEGNKKSITICRCYGSDDEILTPEQITGNKDLEELILHESIHGIFEKPSRECRRYGIESGIGPLERYYNDTEAGRGLNEGLTEWLCEMAGYEVTSYLELTNFVKLIELAIGTEDTLKLFKGNIRENVADLLEMSIDEAYTFLGYSDTIYIADENIEVYKKTKKEDLIPAQKKAKAMAIIKAESMILDKYFSKELDKVHSNNGNVSVEDFRKYKKIISFLNTSYSIPEEVKKRSKKPTSLRVKQEYKGVTKNFIKKFALEEANKYKNGKLSLTQFIKDGREFFGNSYSQLEEFFSEFSKNIDPELQDEMSKILFGIGIKGIEKRFFKKVEKSTLYKLKPKNKSYRVVSAILLNKDNPANNVTFANEYDDKFEFNFKADPEVEDEYEIARKSFFRFKQRVLASKPDSNIYLTNRNIIVRDGDKTLFFYIYKGKIISMEVSKQHKLQFTSEEPRHMKEDSKTSLKPIKVNFISNFITEIKRKWNNFRNRNKESFKNYETDTSRYDNSVVEEDKINLYKVNDFDKKQKQYKSDFKRASQIDLREEDQEK